MPETILKIAVLTHLPPTEDDKKRIARAVQAKLLELEYAGVPSHNVIQNIFVVEEKT